MILVPSMLHRLLEAKCSNFNVKRKCLIVKRAKNNNNTCNVFKCSAGTLPCLEQSVRGFYKVTFFSRGRNKPSNTQQQSSPPPLQKNHTNRTYILKYFFKKTILPLALKPHFSQFLRQCFTSSSYQKNSAEHNKVLT